MSIKVMIGRNGIPRIQEETADTVRVWTHEEWQVEQKRRKEEKVKPVKVVKADPVKDEDGLEDDVEEDEPAKRVSKKK